MLCSWGSYVPQVEDADRVRAVCSAIPTAHNGIGDLVAGNDSASHPLTPDESSSMKSTCPA